MHERHKRPLAWLACLLLIGSCSTAAMAVEAADEVVPPLMLAQAAEGDAPPMTEAPVSIQETVTADEEVEPALPISLAVSYYYLSDYVWRGINFSDHATEHGEQANHQLTTSIAWDTGDYGTIGFDTFFEWYADQKKINPYGGQNLQEVDYVLWWGYSIEPIATDVTVGITWYVYPNLAKLLRQDGARGNNNDDRTTEWWFSLEHNDAWMWKWLFPDNEDGVLNPSFFFAQDFGIGAGAVWMEFGISHEFEIVENLTITPGYLVAVDGGVLRRYLGVPNADHLRFAYDQWSLDVTYDLTPILQLPKWAGSISVSGLLYFNNALGTAVKEIDDELYGGLAVNWAWGG